MEPRYSKPPVIEALCEIFFAESEWDDTVPGRFYELVKSDFPIKEQREFHQAQVSFTAEGEAAAGVRRLTPRMQFKSEDGSRLIQLEKDLLVVNQLRPYPHFAAWHPVIHSALTHYQSLTNPKGIRRLGIRYINRIVIDDHPGRLEDYFSIYPQLPTGMGNAHGAFMIRYEVPRHESGHVILITFATAPADGPNQAAHLLDLYDVYSADEPLPLGEVDGHVQTAHSNVQRSFEGCITDRMRKLFDPEGLNA